MKLFLSSLTLLIACIASAKHHQSQTRLHSTIIATDTVAWDSIEILHPDDLKINGQMSYLEDTKDLLKVLGKPSKIILDDQECGTYFDTQGAKIYWYGNSFFEVLGDTAVLRNIDFTDGKFSVVHPKITLNKNTLLTDFKKHFPNAYKNASERKADDGILYTYMAFRICVQCDDVWVLKFYKGTLIQLEYGIPC